MSRFIMRLDDACEKRDIAKWDRMELLLDKYSIKPLIGVIPYCEDPAMEEYPVDDAFWERVRVWADKGWTIAMHGYNHVYTTSCGGINPINLRSEFAGEPLLVQKKKIEDGIAIMRQHDIDPEVFFAPSHTFDENTITALKECSHISIISDMIANKPYTRYGMTFVPQQSGRVRKLPFHTTTFCYHPNMMSDDDFDYLDRFLSNEHSTFVGFPTNQTQRKKNILDATLEYFYMRRHKR